MPENRSVEFFDAQFCRQVEAREVREGLAIGIEHYAGFGRLGNFAARREQDHVLYLALDYEHKGWSVNFGIGRGLTPAADDRVIKAIIGIPFK